MTNIMECTQRKIGDTVELNLDKETIKVDEENQIIYFKFGCDENGVMEYKDLGFKDVPKTPKSIVAHLFNKDFYTTVIGIDEDEYGDQVVHFPERSIFRNRLIALKWMIFMIVKSYPLHRLVCLLKSQMVLYV